MKILTTSQIQELDEYTIANEPISSIALMERAAKAITNVITERWGAESAIVVFAGPGNNGGDALAVARMLSELGYTPTVYLFNTNGKLSENCAINKQRIIENKNIAFTEISQQFDPPHLTPDTIVIDGLFGTGIKRPLSGGYATLVRYINQSPAQVISIDMPSGLMAEDNTYNITANIIRADLTLTFQQRKLSTMFSECQPFIGELMILDIRLSQAYINQIDTRFSLLEENDLRPLFKPRGDFEHKGTMGNALIIAGSYGMAGAAILATRACLRSGAGKVTLHSPKCNYSIIQTAVPEVVLQMDCDETVYSEPIDDLDFNAVGIGPGLGRHESTAKALIAQIKHAQTPLVIDADAINILATNNHAVQLLPKNTILTPHAKEFERLSGRTNQNSYERLCEAREMAERNEIYILLKGHFSALCIPNGKVIFNSSGNSGMATAGSGDVLTGIITGLLARGYGQEDACKLGMYLHGLAGDLACESVGKESLIASDLIRFLPKAFMKLNT